MNLLVTGGAGYIGSITAELLIEKGIHVIVIDNLQEGHREAVPPKAEFYQGDFGDPGLLKTIFSSFSIDAVLHFAAETTIQLSMTDPALYFQNNLVRGIQLLDVMKESGCRDFIFSSTAATFGEPEYTPIDENHPQRPINAYGESKLMFEGILDWYHRAYGFRFNAFRYFNAAGASPQRGEDHKHESHLIPLVIRQALELLPDTQEKSASRGNGHQPLQVFGDDYPTKDGTCIRDYIHVVDLAEAHILALDNLDRNPRGKYNLGNQAGFSVLEVIGAVEKISGVSISYEIAERRPGDPAVLIASSAKIRKELDWKPRFPDLETIVKTAWEWHSRFPRGYAAESP